MQIIGIGIGYKNQYRSIISVLFCPKFFLYYTFQHIFSASAFFHSIIRCASFSLCILFFYETKTKSNILINYNENAFFYLITLRVQSLIHNLLVPNPYDYIFSFCPKHLHLVIYIQKLAFIQSDLQMRTMEAKKNQQRATIHKCYKKYHFCIIV